MMDAVVVGATVVGSEADTNITGVFMSLAVEIGVTGEILTDVSAI